MFCFCGGASRRGVTFSELLSGESSGDEIGFMLTIILAVSSSSSDDESDSEFEVESSFLTLTTSAWWTVGNSSIWTVSLM